MPKYYVVATSKAWNVTAAQQLLDGLPGHWVVVTRPEDLTVDLLERMEPRYVFFMHWSWRIPAEIIERTECVGFHMTDVPYGRGGSPLQNLIVRGHAATKLTALQIVEEMDAGPVYLKQDLDLAGTAQEIFECAANIAAGMIEHIVLNEPTPEPQVGEPTVFKRRTPDMSRLPEQGGCETLYDHIRMLDAEGYPHAFVDHGDYRLIFRQASLGRDGVVQALVSIRERNTAE